MWETISDAIGSVVDGGKWVLETVGNTFGLGKLGVDIFSDVKGFDIWDWAMPSSTSAATKVTEFEVNEMNNNPIMPESQGNWLGDQGYESDALQMSVGSGDVAPTTNNSGSWLANTGNAIKNWAGTNEGKQAIFGAIATGAIGGLKWALENKKMKQAKEMYRERNESAEKIAEERNQNNLDVANLNNKAKQEFFENTRIKPIMMPTTKPIISDTDLLANQYTGV